MSSGAIALTGGAGVTPSMTVGVTNTKGSFRYGFNTEEFPEPSDEGKLANGSLSPDTVTVGGEDYTIGALFYRNNGTDFHFTVKIGSNPALTATSISTVSTALGTVVLSGATFSTSDTTAQWRSAGSAVTEIFGTTDGAVIPVTYGF